MPCSCAPAPGASSVLRDEVDASARARASSYASVDAMEIMQRLLPAEETVRSFTSARRDVAAERAREIPGGIEGTALRPHPALEMSGIEST